MRRSRQPELVGRASIHVADRKLVTGCRTCPTGLVDAAMITLDCHRQPIRPTERNTAMRQIAGLVVLTLFSSLIFSSRSFAQGCTTYALVAAYDRHSGDVVDNLTAEDFEARVDGKEIPVLNASLQFSNRLLVLVETDGRHSDRVEDAITMATRLARQAPDGQSMAFGVFAKRAAFTQGFIGDEKTRARAIAAVIEEADNLGDKAAMYNALHKALAMFGPHQPGDTVVLIGDGYDDDSNRSGNEVEHEYLSHGTRLVMMFRQPPSDVTGNFNWNPPQHDRALLQDMSAKTGGTYTMFDPYTFSLASHGYLLAIRMPEGDKPVHWKLRVRSGATINPRRVQLHYPERLQPCSDPVAEVSAK
ncbi:MAG TPA: hypothetical protein VKW06_09270 [Candidatus Angelobacter sp.]|nr:hypothetical protein [Candidatus Angelobacter sp.]